MPDRIDALTELQNRRGFLERLHQLVAVAAEKGEQLALVIADIDRFAQINGSGGYAFGDQVLCHTARQMQTVARAQDQVARIGDNRFALIVTRVFNAGHAELAVQKLFRLLEMPFESGNIRIRPAVSAGIALFPMHAAQAEGLLGQAELALITARAEGRPYQFAPDAQRIGSISEMWDIEFELAGAVDRGEMSIHFHPQIRISDRRLVGAEALMRWTSPVRGRIPPDVFIPIAERTGQIRKLTLWAMNTVLRQASQWRHDWGPLDVAVNVPGELAARDDLSAQVDNALQLWGTDAVRLVLEITERSLMDRELVIDRLARIRERGVRISIDDFGTGYSCLAYFKELPVDELKIDKSFVASMLIDAASADITSLIIDLAHRFDLSVVGEGVEDEMTLARLGAAGCDVAQGYLFAKPMPASDFERWLQEYDPGGGARPASGE